MMKMRALLLAAFAASISTAAHATTFLYTGALDSYAVQTSGTYEFTVAGAQGGYNRVFVNGFFCCGGGGALISGDIYLEAGTVLSVLAGGAGMNAIAGDGGSGGSGGGMSFLAIGDAPLIVAGGGAGTGWKGGNAATSPGKIESGDGQGGAPGGTNSGGAGAGWFSDGGTSSGFGSGGAGMSGPGFAGGIGYASDTAHGVIGFGVDGGFGGGGGSGYSIGAGGGGYSGGAPGVGGGSFIDPSATNIAAIAGGNYTSELDPLNGYVTINFLNAQLAAVASVPEPATWAMFLLGFGAVGFALRRRGAGTVAII